MTPEKKGGCVCPSTQYGVVCHWIHCADTTAFKQ